VQLASTAQKQYLMLPDSSRDLIGAIRQCSGSTSVEVDCQKQEAYCLRLHFLDFSIANLFMVLVVPIKHGSSCSYTL